MVKLSGQLICKSLEESEKVRQLLPEHKKLTREESGCISFDVTATADPLVWLVEELFVDQKTFAAHQLRTKNSLWGTETRSILREYKIFEH
ncbi:MAG: antibiotic biosynthesis monooxygenase [Rouxiella aceris]|uniref:putative quinol monooxygenase n=1 Tax=Rouxiella aceris TaxID=2703884 RepID=UPI002845DD42|nr:antibiotic biosynthesis monooxygenase [Rouxiella aceris]MDR3434409.1 antibiotic biosynthesis monooxygenase [Rouxiella aceris]